jgi:transcriptional regulator with XRE-family HTH domain
MQTDPLPPAAFTFQARSAGDLGVAIKYFRTLAGLSQARLAERAGVHRSYLTALEGGHTTEAIERLMTLLGELGLRVYVVKEE